MKVPAKMKLLHGEKIRRNLYFDTLIRPACLEDYWLFRISVSSPVRRVIDVPDIVVDGTSMTLGGSYNMVINSSPGTLHFFCTEPSIAISYLCSFQASLKF